MGVHLFEFHRNIIYCLYNIGTAVDHTTDDWNSGAGIDYSTRCDNKKSTYATQAAGGVLNVRQQQIINNINSRKI